MINIQTILFVAQASSVLTTLVGIVALIYIIRTVHHLENDSFRSIISSLGVFLFITLIGVASMTVYHLVSNSGNERLLENAEILWHAFLFTAIIYSYYESYIAIKFGKSIMRIEKVIHKVSKKK